MGGGGCEAERGDGKEGRKGVGYKFYKIINI